MQNSKVKNISVSGPRSQVAGFIFKPITGNLRHAANYCIVAIITLYLLTFIGCATAPYVTPAITPNIPGIYHQVERGQTLWRISKLYNIDLDEIVDINRISDATNIEVGQLIFIPHRNKVQYSTYKPSSHEDFIWPLKGKIIASFGQTFNNMVNRGINIQPYKTQDVVAAGGGKVVFCADNFEGFGKTIIIDHGNGFSTVYARNSQVFVKAGDFVQKGSLIAKAGSAGRDKNAFLHFQIRKGYVPQNPYFYLTP